MKILIVPEDPVRDQFILKPVVEWLFQDLGRRAQVTVLHQPRLRGVSQALDSSMLRRIAADNSMPELILVLVDRDGDVDRMALATAREEEHAGRLFVCLAIEEVEVWMLAIFPTRLPAPWREVRSERSAKERFAAPFLEQLAPKQQSTLDRRILAMRDLGRQWKGVLERCPELKELRDRLAQRLAS